MEKTKNKDLPIGRDTENVLKEWLKMYNSYMGYLIHSKSYGIR